MIQPGVWTALVTPFTKDEEIDWPAFERLMERQLEAGITGIVIAGTTGESPTLTAQEKLSLARKAHAMISASSGQTQLMVGAGKGGT